MSGPASSRVTGEWTITAGPAKPPPRSALGLLTVFVVLLFGLPARLVFEPIGSTGTPASIFALGCLMLWIASRMVPSLTNSHEPQPVRWAFGFFAISILMSYVNGIIRMLPISETTAADKGLIKLGILCGAALLAADGIRDNAALEKLMGRLVIGGAVLGAIGAVQFATGFNIADYIKIPGLTANGAIFDSIPRGGFRRVFGTATHPIEYGVVLAMILPLALYRALGASGRGRAFRWGCAGLILLAIPMSISRTALLGMVVCLAVLLPTWSGKHRIGAVVAGLLALVAAVIAVPQITNLFYDLIFNITEDNSFTGRTDDYAVVGQYIYEAPVLGRGFATFDPVKYVLLDNQYLGSLIETGAVGFLALLGLFAVGYFSARGARKRSVLPLDRARSQAIAASVAVATVSFVTFDAFAFSMASSLTMLMIGCAGAAWRIAVMTERGEVTRVPGPPPTDGGHPQPHRVTWRTQQREPV